MVVSLLLVATLSSSARALKQVTLMSIPGPQAPRSSAWSSATAVTVYDWPWAPARSAQSKDSVTVTSALCVGATVTTVSMTRPNGVQPNGLVMPPGGTMST